MKALVTGAGGFLGAALTARLRADGVAVRGLVRPDSRRRPLADEVCEGDLRDAAALRRATSGMDLVFHAGARVSTSGSWREFEATNVDATSSLIRCAMEAGARRIIHVSSLSVYAVPLDDAVVTEESAFDDAGGERGLYARSKLEADRRAVDAAHNGAPVVVIRPGLLYGPGRLPPLGRRVIPVGPFRVVLANRRYRLPLAYVDNVVDALCLAARVERAQGRVYTIVDVHAQQANYLRLYRELSGQRWIPVYPPLPLVRWAVGAVERGSRWIGRRSPVSRHQVDRTLRSATFRTDRAERELGWRPQVSLEEALRRTFAAERRARHVGAEAPAQSAA